MQRIHSHASSLGFPIFAIHSGWPFTFQCTWIRGYKNAVPVTVVLCVRVNTVTWIFKRPVRRAGDLVNFVEQCVKRSFVNNITRICFCFCLIFCDPRYQIWIPEFFPLTLQPGEKRNLGTTAPRIVVTPWDWHDTTSIVPVPRRVKLRAAFWNLGVAPLIDAFRNGRKARTGHLHDAAIYHLCGHPQERPTTA